jgi:hypothetical protein
MEEKEMFAQLTHFVNLSEPSTQHLTRNKITLFIKCTTRF